MRLRITKHSSSLWLEKNAKAHSFTGASTPMGIPLGGGSGTSAIRDVRGNGIFMKVLAPY